MHENTAPGNGTITHAYIQNHTYKILPSNEVFYYFSKFINEKSSCLMHQVQPNPDAARTPTKLFPSHMGYAYHTLGNTAVHYTEWNTHDMMIKICVCYSFYLCRFYRFSPSYFLEVNPNRKFNVQKNLKVLVFYKNINMKLKLL